MAISCEWRTKHRREMLLLYSTLTSGHFNHQHVILLAKGEKKTVVGFLIHMQTTQLTPTSGVCTSPHSTVISFWDSKTEMRERGR